jgi:hypothetical protein
VSRFPIGAAAAGVVIAAAGLACGSDYSSSTSEPARKAPAEAPRQLSSDTTHEDFDRARFTASARIDNTWSPLVPGTQYILEGRSNRGAGRRAHRVIFTVTDLTKVIDGVRTVVMWDQDINAGKLLEAELAFHAQDDEGNVWNMGEYPEENDEEGKFDGAPDTWLSGVAGARAGVLMRGDPQTGTSSYMHGSAPDIGFGDVAKVHRRGARTCVPAGCYDDVLVTDETNPLEPGDGHQRKFYARGVGNVRAAPGPGGKEREVLELVEVRRLGAEELAQVRRNALKLEARAYRAVKDVYGESEPARPIG